MKRNQGFHIVLCVVLTVLLFLPLVQQEFHPFPVKKLNGAAVKAEKPKLDLNTYRDMSYQTQLEDYVADRFGFRESVIRLYNQYLWMFRKTYAADVVVGKDRWLYSKTSVLDHYRQRPYEFETSNEALKLKFEKELKRLKTVQELLARQGTQLFVLICPAKDMVYPEHLPEGDKFVMGDGLRAIDYYPQAFAEKGIHCLDVCTWFQQIKDTVGYPLFPQRGMHWSNIACVHASDSIFRYMEQLTGKNMPDLEIGPLYHDATRNPDGDLEQNLNLAWGILPAEHNCYANVEVVRDSAAQQLNLITIGDSFFWNMCYALPMDSIFNRYVYWYYFNTVYFDPEHTNVSQVDLMEELDRADVVMISLSATQLYEINHGFLSQALLQLTLDDPDRMSSILEGVEERMRSDSLWYESLKEKAAKRGVSLDEAMRADALYIISQNPEQYLE